MRNKWGGNEPKNKLDVSDVSLIGPTPKEMRGRCILYSDKIKRLLR